MIHRCFRGTIVDIGAMKADLNRDSYICGILSCEIECHSPAGSEKVRLSSAKAWGTGHKVSQAHPINAGTPTSNTTKP